MITEIANVRSANGSPATGFELKVSDLSILGETTYLADALQEKVRSVLYTDCRVSVEAAMAEFCGEMRYGMNFRFRLSDPFTTDQDLSAFREKARSMAIALLAERGITANFPSVGGGTVAALPAKDFVFLRKQQINGCPSAIHGFSSVPAFFFAPLDKAAINWKEVDIALRVNRNSGLSVNIIPAEPSAAAQKLYTAAAGETGASEDYRRAYKSLLNSPISYHYIITVWGKAKKEILALLELGGVSFKKISIEDVNSDLLYCETALDPWQLSDRLCEYRCSRSVGEAAYTVTQNELEAFLLAHEITAPVGDLPDPAPTVERIKTEVQPDADELSSLEKDILSLDEGLAGLAEKIEELKKRTPLYEMLDRMNSIEDKLDEIMSSRQNTPASASILDSLQQIKNDIISQVSDSAAGIQSRIDEQSDKISGKLDDTEASINQNIDSKASELSRKFDDLLAKITPSTTPQEAIAEARTAGISFKLTDEDVRMLGFNSKEELSADLGDQKIFEALEYAIGFYKLAETANKEGKCNYIPFVMMIGYLYELIANKYMDGFYEKYKVFLDKNMVDELNGNLKRWDDNFRKTGRGVFDKVPPGRIQSQYRRSFIYSNAVIFSEELRTTGYFGSKMKATPFNWEIWFALFFHVRQLRNYIHGINHSTLSAEKAEILFDAFFSGNSDARSRLISGNIVSSTPEYAKSNPKDSKFSKIFELSIFRFILMLRQANWDSAAAEIANNSLPEKN